MVWTGAIALVTALFLTSDPGGPGWRWPLRPPPEILRSFDPPAHPWEAGHRGTDLAARPGQPVYAAGPGRVGFARDLAGRGVVTVIHGRLRTTYLPVRPSVHAGQEVTAGARIGVVESLLGHCGQSPCLHWGLREGTTYFDPLTLLGRGPVRLLPWWYVPEPLPPPAVRDTTGQDGMRAVLDGLSPSERQDEQRSGRPPPLARPIGPCLRSATKPPATTERPPSPFLPVLIPPRPIFWR
jgi:hypothetical protein